MADELFISATFDGSDLISGMDEVASAIAEGSSNIATSFQEIISSGEEAGSLFEMLTGSSQQLGANLSESASTLAAAAVGMQQYSVSLGEGVEASGELAAAMATLEAEVAKGVANIESIAIAFEEAKTTAEALGYQTLVSAEGLQILTREENNVTVASEKKTAAARAQASALGEDAVASNALTESITGTDRAIGFATGRMVAGSLGASQLSYTLGFLGRSLPTLTEAFQYLFAPILVLTFAEIIESIVEKFEKLDENIHKAETSFDNLGLQAQTTALNIQLTNDKLEDSIIKLEGRIVPNGIAEGALEAKLAIDKALDSISKLIEKEQELSTTTGQVSWFSLEHFFKGVEPTTLEEEIIAPFRQTLQDKLELQRQANLTGSAQEKADAVKAVEDARKAAQDKAEAMVSAIKTRIADQSAYEATHVTLPLEHVDYEPLLKKAESEVREFKSLKDLETDAAKEGQLKQTDVVLTEAEKRYSANRALGIASVDAQQKLDVQAASFAKENAELKLKTVEEDVKTQAAAEEAGGALRLKSEVDTYPKLINARKDYNASILKADQDKLDSQIAAAESHRDIDLGMPDEAKRRDTLITDNAKIKELQAQREQDKLTLTQEGNNAVLALESSQAEKEIQLKRETTLRLEREDNQRFLNQIDAEDKGLRALEEKAREDDRLRESGKMSRTAEIADLDKITSQMQKLRDLEESQIKARLSGLESKLPTLTIGSAEEAEVSKEIEELKRKLVQVQNEYTSALDRTQAEADKLDISIRKFIDDLASKTLTAGISWQSFTDQFRISFENAIGQVNNRFADSVGQWILHGGNFVRAMQNMGAELVASLAEDFIRLGLVMLEKWLLSLVGIDSSTKASNAQNIASYAAVAGAAGTASMAAAPFPIDLSAPAFGAAMYAAALSYLATVGFAEGGYVRGKGSGTSDSIPAMLSDGEFVVKASAVSQPGVLEALHGLNAGYAGGGYVTTTERISTSSLITSTPLSPSPSGAAGGRFLFNQTINGAGLSPREVGEQAYDYIRDKLRRSGINI